MKILSYVFTLFLTIFVAAPALAAPEVAPSERVRRNVVIRAAPDGDADRLGRLMPGEHLALEGETAGWYQVRLPDGQIGFVSKAWTIVIEGTGSQPLTEAAQRYRVHVIDVGTGLAVFIEGPDFTMLYDGGSQDDLASGPDNRIVAYINAVHPGLKTIDHLILSHPHKDHLELLPDIFDRFVVRNVWDSGRVNNTRGYCRFLRQVQAEPGVLYHDAIATGGFHEVTFTGSGCSGLVRIPQAQQMSAAPVALGAGAQMAILYRDTTPYPDPNGNSVVVRLDLGNSRVLLAGDAEGGERRLSANPPDPQSIEGRLLSCCVADLRADVLVVGHHGSLTSTRAAFLHAVNPSISIISSGPHAYSGRVLPDPEIQAELHAQGQLFSTAEDDDVCATDTSKIGPDSDESPGGCKNVLVLVGAGIPTASYNEISD